MANKTNKKIIKTLLKGYEDSITRSRKLIKEVEKDSERIDLEVKIGFYRLQEAISGNYHDEYESKEQRRRLWMLSIIKHKEDDEFLRRHGLIHISRFLDKSMPKIKIPLDIKVRAHETLRILQEDKKSGKKSMRDCYGDY
jgi:hypothetical protein